MKPLGVLDRDDLVLANYSLPRGIDFEARVRAAAEAGFSGIGLDAREYSRQRAEGQTDSEMRAILAHHGQQLVEIEILRGWSAAGEELERYLASEAAVTALSDALGPAHHVQLVGPYDGDADHAAEAFAGVCDRLDEHGLTVSLEFLPEMSNIPDAATAMDIVTKAGRANGGLCIDSWHHFRGANDWEQFRRVPPERVFGVQFDDGPAAKIDPDYKVDCMHHREVPGEGVFDLVEFLLVLDEIGVQSALSIEVISDRLLALPLGDAAQQMADGSRQVLAQARAARDAR